MSDIVRFSVVDGGNHGGFGRAAKILSTLGVALGDGDFGLPSHGTLDKERNHFRLHADTHVQVMIREPSMVVDVAWAGCRPLGQ